MIKKLFVLLTILSITPVAFSEDHSNGIAVINAEKIKTDTKAGQSIAQQLTDVQTKFKEKITKLTQDFDAKKQELDKQKTVLSKEAFAKKEADFNTKLAESRKDLQQEANKIEQMQQVAMAELNAIARGVIEDLVKTGHYLHVLPAEVVIHADPKSDITSQVIAGIDKKADKITLKEPSKDAAATNK